MARTRTAEQMVQDVLERTNLENSEFVTPEEVLEYLNQERAELDSRLRRNEGQVHRSTTTTIAVVAGTVSYALPADFWELLGITGLIDGWQGALEPFMETERASLMNSILIIPAEIGPRYRISGAFIDFLPSTKSFTATMRYVAGSTRLRLGMTPPDTIDGYNGYEVAMIFGACATALAKEESDPSFYLSEKARIYRLIDANAAQRDASRPERVTDVHGGLPSPWDI